MAQPAGWRNVLITLLGTATLGVGGAYFLLSAGKADKTELKEHVKEPAHLEQRIVNERIYNRLGNLEVGQQVLHESIRALPAEIVKELAK